MKRHIYITSLLFFVLIGNSKAQDYLSFYNLKGYVPQTQNISPVYLPKYAVNFGTPLNLGVNINSEIKLNDILVESGNNLKFDFNNLNSVAAETNLFATDVTANIFTLGIKTKKGSISFFANAKSNAVWQFSDDFTGIAANGFGQSFSLSREKFGATAYSEIGIGLTRTFFKDKLAIGIRLKSLSGIAHAQIEDGAQLSIDINQSTFLWSVTAANASVNTSGINDTDNLAFFGKNSGFGMDLGFDYKLSDKLSFEFSINDLGSISWTEDVTNYNIQDVVGAEYNGFDFQNAGNVQDEIEDAINDVIGTSETSESFETKIGSRTFLSAKYQISERNAFRATYFSNNNPFVDIKPSFALGYNRTLKKSTYGVVVSSGGNAEGTRFGGNFAMQLGFLQLYAAIDDFSNISSKVEESNGANLRFGLNFLFGYRGKSKDKYDFE